MMSCRAGVGGLWRSVRYYSRGNLSEAEVAKYRDLLRIAPEVQITPKLVKKSYLRESHLHHPDKHAGDALATKRFQEISQGTTRATITDDAHHRVTPSPSSLHSIQGPAKVRCRFSTAEAIDWGVLGRT
jgi:hypothetical protein